MQLHLAMAPPAVGEAAALARQLQAQPPAAGWLPGMAQPLVAPQEGPALQALLLPPCRLLLPWRSVE